MNEIYVAAKRIRLETGALVGSGGEAEVFDIGRGQVVKIFKPFDHPDFAADPAAQAAATARLDEHQRKLPAFPKGLPERVIAPQVLAMDRTGKKILGYVMPFLSGTEVLLRYAERGFRQGIGNAAVIALFRDLHATVVSLHAHQVVIGDFNDLNVLVRGSQAYLIDADSMQFGGFLSRVFTERFVDPQKCDAREPRLLLVKPHDADSDWYAYAVMLMQSLLFVGPYGGIYRPKDPNKRIPHDARPLRRITVFHPEVQYPKPAIPFGVLPDDLLHHFEAVFVKDRRGSFPLALVETLRWTRCAACGTEHARRFCPRCQAQAPAAAVIQTVVVRGTVKATHLFHTRGTILRAAVEKGRLLYLYHERDAYRREGDVTILAGALDTRMRFRLKGPMTVLAKDGQAVKLEPGKPAERFATDRFQHLAAIDANAEHLYWSENGRLMRDGDLGPVAIGEVLPQQTLFWVGPTFGVGFYRAQGLTRGFIFGTEARGLNDTLALTPVNGQLLDACAVFTAEHAWLCLKLQLAGKLVYRLLVIHRSGRIDASLEAEEGIHPWLASLRGGCGTENSVLAPTDEGIVRIEMRNGQIVKTKEFPDTEPFVSADCRLLPVRNGLYVVGRQDITEIAIR